MSLCAKVICMVACHGGSADHFAVFANNLIQEGYQVQVYASYPVIKKFQDRDIRVIPFALGNLAEEVALADLIANACRQAAVVLTDVGHPFDEKLQYAFKKKSPKVLRLAYYDNPEPEVPGGYSEVAAKVMKASQAVLFANANLVKTSLTCKGGEEIHIPINQRIGIGYYPLIQAEKIACRRIGERDLLRKQFLQKYGMQENGQKLFVYFGGNNEEYYKKAFPTFLHFLSETIEKQELSNFQIILQQHPGAKILGEDQKFLEEWLSVQKKLGRSPQVILSQETTEDMQVLADAALYYQTSMGPIFALAGIPVIQVAHKIYPDVLVRSGLCSSVTSAYDFINALSSIQPKTLSEEMRSVILQSLGIQKDWFCILKKALLQEENTSH